MKLTEEAINEIANRLEEAVANHFNDAIYNTLIDQPGGEYVEVTDEDIALIKLHLKIKL
jgi:hypothetical protein